MITPINTTSVSEKSQIHLQDKDIKHRSKLRLSNTETVKFHAEKTQFLLRFGGANDISIKNEKIIQVRQVDQYHAISNENEHSLRSATISHEKYAEVNDAKILSKHAIKVRNAYAGPQQLTRHVNLLA